MKRLTEQMVVDNLVVNNGEALTVWLRTSLPGEGLDQVELRVVGGGMSLTPERREELLAKSQNQIIDWGEATVDVPSPVTLMGILRDLIHVVEKEAGQAGYTQGQEDMENQHKNLMALERIEGRKESRWVTCPECENNSMLGDGVHRVGGAPCPDCGGTGKVSRERIAELELAEYMKTVGERRLVLSKETPAASKYNADAARVTLADAKRMRHESDRREAERRKARGGA